MESLESISTKSAADPERPLWRRIEGALKRSIIEGRYPPGSQLPPDRRIAEFFGANRLTARRALASLEQQGLIRIEQGNGTFVADRLRYSLGRRVRFNQNLVASNAEPRRDLLDAAQVAATQLVADYLTIESGAPVLKFDLVGYADETPISVVSRYAPADRFGGLIASFKRTKSFTEALKEFGIHDFQRKMTEITTRFPTTLEARLLKQPKTQPVLAYESVDIDGNGVPISCQIGCFSGDRVALVIS
jgi:GntR family phosphonate transport system transcriptional regulator